MLTVQWERASHWPSPRRSRAAGLGTGSSIFSIFCSKAALYLFGVQIDTDRRQKVATFGAVDECSEQIEEGEDEEQREVDKFQVLLLH